MKSNIYRGSVFLFINTLISISAVLLFYMVFNQSGLDSAIDWAQLYTKKFVLFSAGGFLLLCLTFKFQMTYLSREHAAARMSDNPFYRVVFTFVFIVVSSFVLHAILQFFQQNLNVDLTIDWIQGKTKIFLLGSFFLLFLHFLFFSISGRLYFSFFISMGIVLLLGLTQSNKMTFLGEPLYPSDFKQITHMAEVVPMIIGFFSLWKFLILVFLLFVIIGYVVILYSQMQEIKVSWWMRGVFLFLSILICYSFFNYPKTYAKSWIEKSDVKVIRWNQPSNYRDNGFIFGFLSNMHVDAFDKPVGYNKKAVLEIADRIKKESDSNQSNSSNPKKPNIVFIMSEGFWDPTRLENVKFSKDPMSITRALMEKHSSGNLLSPTFGGGTANTEFEALTGLSMRFLKAGSLPYQQLIDQKEFIPTIVSELESNKYKTVAIHPYNKVFYKRNRVYKTFGFNKFLNMDTMKHKEISGSYISDESVAKEILGELKQKEQPVFIHAVTMQNHFPYTADRFEKRSISVSGLSEKAKVELEVYAEGISRSDQALDMLVNKLETFDEPTVVVLWGDHLPILGQNKAIYNEAKYAAGLDPKVQLQKYSETPLLIYSNYKINRQDLKDMSPSFIGPTVFSMTGLKQPPFYSFLEELKNELPGIKPGLLIDHNQKTTFALTKKQQQLLREYQLLEYDLLVGKQYSKDILFH